MPEIFIVEGNIGSGKSTFLTRVKELLKDDVQIIYEPLEEWLSIKDENGKNILDYFYTDMERFCYAFQSMAFITRYQKTLTIDYTKKYVFIERSIFSDKKIFAENCRKNNIMTEIEWKIYLEWFDSMSKLIKFPHRFIYLKCSPEVSYQRLKGRNREEEKEVPLGYLRELYQRHEDWLVVESEKENKNIIINGELDFKTEDKVMVQYLKNIIKSDDLVKIMI
jgi:deoxyadenosine/deoxycytidine kinase